MRRFVALLTALLLLLFAAAPGAAFASRGGLDVTPETVGVSLTYAGSRVRVSGEVPAGTDVYLKVSSAPTRVTLKEMGRKAVFWLGVKQVEVKGVPKVYQLYSSAPFARLNPELAAATGIDPSYAVALRDADIQAGHGVQVTPAERRAFLGALVGIYEKRGLYTVAESSVRVEGGRFTVDVSVPPGVPQGEIGVTAYAVRDGRVVAQDAGVFRVQSTGLVRFIRQLAATDGPDYGALAVLVALAAGTVVGVGFSYLERLASKTH